MLASEIIEKLRLPDGTSKPLFSLIGGDSSRRLFVCRFGCLEDYPTILITVDEPLPENKDNKVLLEELFIWINQDNYPDSEVYLESIFEYPDESYDFRYFKLQTIRDEGDHLLLIGDKAEALELRQHYDAFDESMYADEEE